MKFDTFSFLNASEGRIIVKDYDDITTTYSYDDFRHKLNDIFIKANHLQNEYERLNEVVSGTVEAYNHPPFDWDE